MDVSAQAKTDVKTTNGMIQPGTFRVVAGPCTVESYEQFEASARAVKEAGFEYVRGGAFKPRTSPYSFQGLGEEGLEILSDVSKELGLKVVTEVMDPYDIEMVMEHAQVIQIGARNMANFSLLKRIGGGNRRDGPRRRPQARARGERRGVALGGGVRHQRGRGQRGAL